MARILLFTTILVLGQAIVDAHFNCSAECMEGIKMLRLQEIQEKILSALRVRNVDELNARALRLLSDPNFAPDYRLMAERTIGDEENYQEEAIITSVDASRGTDPSLISTFLPSSSLHTKKIGKAVLVVWLEPVEVLRQPRSITVRVFEIGNNNEIVEEVLRQEVVIIEADSVQLELPLSSFERWIEGEAFHLRVEAILDGKNIAIHPQDEIRLSGDRRSRKAMQINVLMEQAATRRRRSPKTCVDQNTEKGCCLQDMMVDFKKMGWSFIIAPHRYNAFVCRGDCRYNHMQMTQFGHTKLVREGAADDVSHPTCCHPSEYESLKIIYTDGGSQLIVSRVPGMIARKCTCS